MGRKLYLLSLPRSFYENFLMKKVTAELSEIRVTLNMYETTEDSPNSGLLVADEKRKDLMAEE